MLHNETHVYLNSKKRGRGINLFFIQRPYEETVKRVYSIIISVFRILLGEFIDSVIWGWHRPFKPDVVEFFGYPGRTPFWHDSKDHRGSVEKKW